MARKKWTASEEITPSLLKFREKRKWQIALRRYVIEQLPCIAYASYFGLDSKSLRNWFEMQFSPDTGWSDFAQKWQFDHIIPVTYFDFSLEHDLRLCWNFTNLRVETIKENKDRGTRIDVLGAKTYFETLYEVSKYKRCLELVEKIQQIELSELASSIQQQTFLCDNKEYLVMIEDYSAFEFELLNSGRSPEMVKKEIQMFKKFGSRTN